MNWKRGGDWLTGHCFETLAFYVKVDDARYHDIDVTRQINFSSLWSVGELNADDRANDMHEVVVAGITSKMVRGERL